MNDFVEGDVVICETGQIGCMVDLEGQQAWVLLKNGDLWQGTTKRLRKPQDQADIDACPLDVEKKVRLEKVSR